MRIGILGDIHLHFDAIDVEQLDAARYAAVFFVGDIAAYSHRGGLRVAEQIAKISTPSILIPGNHDAVHAGQLAVELLQADPLVGLMNFGQVGRERSLADALGSTVVGGYSLHRFEADSQTLDVLACRPHSMGGGRLAFRRCLSETHGVDSLEESTRRLIERVDESDADHLVFLAHNGPTGLGDSREDIWGCDFRKEEGDFGDPDLEAAVAHAKKVGKPVRAVVAGHMHHHLRGGGKRRWQLEDEGVLYVNAARVPRIFERGQRILRHHVELTINNDGAKVREVLNS